MTKLSIITICYNEQKYIRTTCKRIVSQSFQDFEWIVVDGGSTDGTLDILEIYKDRMNIFISEKDNGSISAVNKGIQKAKGEYVLQIHGGDYLSSDDVLEKVQQYLYLNKDILYGDCGIITEEGIPTSKFIAPPSEDIGEYFFCQNNICTPSTFIRKELFQLYGLYDEQYKVVTDWEKWIVFNKNSVSFYKIPEMITCFRLGGISNSPKYRSQHMEERGIVLKKHYTDEELLAVGIVVRVVE